MRASDQLPHVNDHLDAIVRKLRPQPAVFLDFDGTLAPIVDVPDAAVALPGIVPLLDRLARLTPVAVVSGRALSDLIPRIGLEGVAYAGSHGFEIRTPDGSDVRPFPRATELLEGATARLRDVARATPGSQVEDKRFATTLHLRGVAASLQAEAVARAEDIAMESGLRVGHGKKVVELHPPVDWHKGRAVEWFLDRWTTGSTRPPAIFIGDDLTDEHALTTLSEAIDVGVLVRPSRPRPTAARWVVEDPSEVADLLSALTEGLEADRGIAE